MRQKIGRRPPDGSSAALSRYRATEKKLSARKNHPLVIFGSQLARNAFDSRPPIASIALGMIDRHVALATACFVIPGEPRNPLEQGGLSGAVFTDDDGDGAFEIDLEIVLAGTAGKTDRPRDRATRDESSQTRLR